jgi:subtilisin family serine protease
MTKINYSHPLAVFFIVFTLIGCSSTSELTETIETTTEPETIVEEVPVEELSPTEDWHLQTPTNDPFYGTGVHQAYAELLSDKEPQKEVIVAIIDSGTDIEHEDLSSNIWVNEDEIPNNGIDDDGNGYIDDIHGWNFIGGSDGSHVTDDTFEITRLYSMLSAKYEGTDVSTLDDEAAAEYEYYEQIKVDFYAERDEINQIFENVTGFEQAIMGARQVFNVPSLDSLTSEQIAPNPSDPEHIAQSKGLVNYMRANDIKESDVTEAKEQFESLAKYGMNPDFDPRPIVGDDYTDLTNRFYGNNDVSGPENDHGTHVAGIVGAVRNNGFGMDGIADVKLMIVRTVPNGDERDKDVANAIRYAAENGADVINMSFGKGYSPEKWYVDSAIQFADSMGVLMVHGAGNDGENNDITDNFPSNTYEDGGVAVNYIEVGASSWEEGYSLPAEFSNYGKLEVDIFAPGVAIYSTFPENEYSAQDGTSMASPVVAGVAALIMSYYPDLTATQVKEILLETATIPSITMVEKPGSYEEPEMIPFSQLSVSGGIVNAYDALKLAEEISEN